MRAPGSAAATSRPGGLQDLSGSGRRQPAGDPDSDGLANSTELAYSLDPCIADTDGDSMIDGYEFSSARDLNGTAVPYPGERPWPNPLDPTDINYDFDGDGLSPLAGVQALEGHGRASR